MFAYREIPDDSLKFSPCELLLYGRRIRGPTTILHVLWINDEIGTEVKSTYQDVSGLYFCLENTAKLAASHTEIGSENYKYDYC